MLITTVGINKEKKIPGLDDARKMIVTERQDVVKQLKEAEANVRAARQAGDTKIIPKFEQDMAAANKKIKFLDSRLANPNLAITYANVKRTAQPIAPLPKKTQEKFGTFFGQEGVDKALKPTSFQNILLGDTDVQQLIQTGQKDFAKMTQNLQNKVGFGYLPKNMFFDFVRGALDPATYTEDLSNIFGNPAKFMDETFYNITDTNKSAGERAGASLNFAFFVAGLIPGMKSLTKPAKEAFEKAAKSIFKDASLKGIKVADKIIALNASPETTQRLLKMAYEAGVEKVKSQAKSTAVAVTKGLGQAGETAKDLATGRAKIAVKQPAGVFSGIPLPKFAVAPTFKTSSTISDKFDIFIDEGKIDKFYSIKDLVNETISSISRRGKLSDADFLQAYSPKIRTIREQISKDKKLLENNFRQVTDAINNLDDRMKIIVDKTPGIPNIGKQPNLAKNGEYQRLRKEKEALKAKKTEIDDAIKNQNAKSQRLEDIDEMILKKMADDPFFTMNVKPVIPTPSTKTTKRPPKTAGFVNVPTLKEAVDFVQSGFDWIKSGALFGGDKEYQNQLKNTVFNRQTGIRLIDPNLTTARRETDFIIKIQDALNKWEEAGNTRASFDFNAWKAKAPKSIPQNRADFLVDGYNNKEIFFDKGNNFAVIFPQTLQQEIRDQLILSSDKWKKANLVQKIWYTLQAGVPGLQTQKRIFAQRLPVLSPTIEKRAATVAGLETRLDNESKILLDAATKVKPFKDTQDYKDLVDVIMQTPLKDLDSEIGQIITRANIPKELEDYAYQIVQRVRSAQRLNRALLTGKFDTSKTLLENLVKSTDDTMNKVFNVKLYKQKPYYDEVTDTWDYTKLAKIFDPTAITDELNRRVFKQTAVKTAVEEQNRIKTFLENYIANQRTNKSRQNNLAPETIKMMQTLVNSIENVTKQIYDIAPDFDTALEKLSGEGFDLSKILEKGVKKASAAQISGNIRTALSQTAPLAFTFGETGLFNTLQGLVQSALNYDVKGNLKGIFKDSNFLKGRFSDANQLNIYKTVRDDYIKSLPAGGKKLYASTKALFSEKFLDNFTRAVISGTDRFVSQAVWAAAYQKAMAQGRRANLPEAELKRNAAKIADDIAERIIAGREAGAAPAIFATKIGRTVFQYGLEVMNQPQVLKDLSRMREGGNVAQKIAGYGKAMAWYLGSAYLINNLTERASNARPLFDPIGLVEEAFKSEKKTSKTLIPEPKVPVPFTGVSIPLPERVPSKPYTSLMQLPKRIVESLSGVSKVGSILEAPAFSAIKSIYDATADVAKGTQSKEDKQEYAQDFAMKFAATFIKGGNQARKLATGLQAIFGTYNDPRYTNLKDVPNWEEYSDRKFEEESRKIIDANIYEKASKSMKVQMANDLFRAILFGAKGTEEYRQTLATSFDLKEMLRQATIDKQLADTPQAEAMAQRQIDDIKETIYKQNLQTTQGQYKPVPLPEDPEIEKRRKALERKRKK